MLRLLLLAASFCVLAVSVLAQNAEIKKLRSLVNEVQLEMISVQEELTMLVQEQSAELEQLHEQVRILTNANHSLQQEMGDLLLKNSLMQDELKVLQDTSAGKQYEEMQQLARALVLYRIQEPQALELTLLELINEGANFPKDLLILMLGEAKRQQGIPEESLGFFVTIITDFPESPYLNYAIFQASELLGELEQPDEQSALLDSLRDDPGRYGELARERLQTLGQ
ncbi:MAG: hypothetical protein VX420_05905 [SAR324 cluster bacterium]|jgi:hypothetical protein|nr:hypothetical protein [SAR324 cluster bacterium]HBI29830.1 hypothetical protein [Deltaproteobacteria bacterium]HIF69109.1 hypothetical protein [Candidatus Lambdaproteobacteria bacterium]MEC7417731.1 hypothetical protein [SAR324 cluster bacterium]MEE2717743.1 hypothetical protein [SAR324 cluster bacterium]|tara:strand:+ start:104 stop:781 length:678 start_codon:yes stop_codon:yes gene_type:complete